MAEVIKQGKASMIDPTQPRGPQIEALKEMVKQCYCGLGPACEIWRKMTPEEREACTRDKRAYEQLLWKHGVR